MALRVLQTPGALLSCLLAAACGEIVQGTTAHDAGPADARSSHADHEAPREASPPDADISPDATLAPDAISPDAADSDADACVIYPSSYKIGCVSAAGCAAVWFGNVCTAGPCAGCEPNSSISVASIDAYQTDLSNLEDGGEACNCPPPQGAACCMDGVCTYFPGQMSCQ